MSKRKCECSCGANREPTDLQKKEKEVRGSWLYYKNMVENKKDTTLIGTCKRFMTSYDGNKTRLEEKARKLKQEVWELQAKIHGQGLDILDLP